MKPELAVEKPEVVVVVVVDEPRVVPELDVVKVVPVPSVEMAAQPDNRRAAIPAKRTFEVYEVITPNLFVYLIPTKRKPPLPVFVVLKALVDSRIDSRSRNPVTFKPGVKVSSQLLERSLSWGKGARRRTVVFKSLSMVV